MAYKVRDYSPNRILCTRSKKKKQLFRFGVKIGNNGKNLGNVKKAPKESTESLAMEGSYYGANGLGSRVLTYGIRRQTKL